MHIVIIGAGLIGISSAYFLAKEGYQVSVYDSKDSPGQGTSFANGGQISVCYSEPWASTSNLKKMIKWLGREDSPILFKPSLDMNQISWGIQFLLQCSKSNNLNNIKKLIELSLYSRNTLQEMRKELGDKLSYNHSASGILTIYSNPQDYLKGIYDAHFMSQFGCDRIIKTIDETFALAPFLKNSQQQIFGSDYSEHDESGDALMYCQELYEVCKSMGVKFYFNHHVQSLNPNSNNGIKDISVVPVINGDYKLSDIHNIQADAFVLAAASYTPQLLSHINQTLPIYPVKGYSATLSIKDNSLVSEMSITDSSHKMVFTKIGDKLRIAGTAEFNGFNYEPNLKRSMALINRAKQLYSQEALDFDNPTFWNGLRPTTPNSIPIIKPINNNLYVNAGHGTLGFTMAAGSGKMMADIIKQYQ